MEEPCFSRNNSSFRFRLFQSKQSTSLVLVSGIILCLNAYLPLEESGTPMVYVPNRKISASTS